MNPIYKTIGLISLIALVTISCNGNKKKVYTIGFSQCTNSSDWRKQMIHEMKVEASFHDNVELLIEDAQGNNDLQVRQIQGLIDKKVDLLIISPNESKPITPIAEKAFRQGIPTILIDRKIESEMYSSFIGGDNYLIGNTAVNYLRHLANKPLNVLEVWGLEGSSPARERHKGFRDLIASNATLKVVGEIHGDWYRKVACEKATAFPALGQVQVVYAHNDEMALGVYEACRQKKIDTGKMLFIGVDALQGKEGGIQAVIDKKLTATLLYPTGGGKAIQVALDILNKKPYQKLYLLSTALVDKTNAEILKQQSAQINDYLGKIETELQTLNFIEARYSSQKTLLYVSVGLLFVAMILTLLLYFAYRNMKKIYLELQLKNNEINHQREELSLQHEQLLIMNERIEEVTAQKLRFFTNVSHELRTPMSLMISPVEHILEMNKYPDIHPELVVLKNNIDRMLRMIGQLLDFRKLEVNEMRLYVRKQNIVALVRNAKAAFNYEAADKEIDYSLTFPDEEIELFCDSDKTEKVLLNLLSNAFKFTPRSGRVHIDLNDEPDKVSVSITNSGKGMNQEERAHIFNLINEEGEDYRHGTGIGLKMAKEYVELHGGKIGVDCKPGESTFTFSLKKGKEHFFADKTSFVQDGEYLSEVKRKSSISEVATPEATRSNEYNVLIVEEDYELRDYLNSRLKKEYRIYVATDGDDGLQVLRNAEINLIICDAVLPDMDGAEFCKLVKSDFSISHIPIVLLTVQLPEGESVKTPAVAADDYLCKPFNESQLESKARELLLQKRQTRDYFMNEFFRNDSLLDALDSPDKQFVQQVCTLLDRHIGESKYGPENLKKELGLSLSNLYRKIKDITGCSPGQFADNYRVKRSLALLAEKNFAVHEIASRCGFVSPVHYSECFKEVMGILPSDYQ